MDHEDESETEMNLKLCAKIPLTLCYSGIQKEGVGGTPGQEVYGEGQWLL